MSRLEKTTNWLVAINIAVMLSFSLGMAFFNYDFANNHQDHQYIFQDLESAKGLAFASFFSFSLIMNRLIPLELPICMEIAKFIATYFMQGDAQMTRIDTMTGRINELRCNTLNLHEELGEIEYIFCDKTGTLTQNELVFNTFSYVTDNGTQKIGANRDWLKDVQVEMT